MIVLNVMESYRVKYSSCIVNIDSREPKKWSRPFFIILSFCHHTNHDNEISKQEDLENRGHRKAL